MPTKFLIGTMFLFTNSKVNSFQLISLLLSLFFFGYPWRLSCLADSPPYFKFSFFISLKHPVYVFTLVCVHHDLEQARPNYFRCPAQRGIQSLSLATLTLFRRTLFSLLPPLAGQKSPNPPLKNLVPPFFFYYKLNNKRSPDVLPSRHYKTNLLIAAKPSCIVLLSHQGLRLKYNLAESRTIHTIDF